MGGSTYKNYNKLYFLSWHWFLFIICGKILAEGLALKYKVIFYILTGLNCLESYFSKIFLLKLNNHQKLFTDKLGKNTRDHHSC